HQPPIRRSSWDGELPLSFAQQRLWFLDQLVPGSPVYNIPTAVRLRGPLNVAALGQALNEAARRPEALPATFAVVDGQPLHVSAPALTVQLRVVDLREWPEAEREAEGLRLIRQEAQRPFDLARGPLLRGAFLRVGEEEYVGLLTMHHIVSDGWSTG